MPGYDAYTVSEYKVREARDDDYVFVAEAMAGMTPWVEVGASVKGLLWDMTHPCVRSHVAESADGEVLGLVSTVEHGMALEPLIEFLVVMPSERRRGVGSALAEFCETELFPDAPNLYLFVSDYNHAGMVFWERRGYHEVGRLSDLDLPGAAEVMMRMSRGLRQVGDSAR